MQFSLAFAKRGAGIFANAKIITRFLSDHTSVVDYYIAIRPEGDYDGLLQRYTSVTVRSPMIRILAPDTGSASSVMRRRRSSSMWLWDLQRSGPVR